MQQHGYQEDNDEARQTDEQQQNNDHTAKDADVEQPRHYSGGTIKGSQRILEGRDVPKPSQLQDGDQEKFDAAPEPGDDEPQPAPAGMKPNDLITLPPGSVKAPSSIPGAPPTDVVVPEKEEDEAEPKEEDE